MWVTFSPVLSTFLLSTQFFINMLFFSKRHISTWHILILVLTDSLFALIVHNALSIVFALGIAFSYVYFQSRKLLESIAVITLSSLLLSTSFYLTNLSIDIINYEFHTNISTNGVIASSLQLLFSISVIYGRKFFWKYNIFKKGINIRPLLLFMLIPFSIFLYNLKREFKNGFHFFEMVIDFSSFLIGLLISIILLVIVMYIYIQKYRIKYQAIQLHQLRKYNEDLENLYVYIRKFQHDYMNIFLTLTEYIETENIRDLKKYFYNEIAPFSEKISTSVSQFGELRNINSAEVKSLFAFKLDQARKNGLYINVEVPDYIHQFNFKKLELCQCLGIILDNAIEASLQSVDKKLEVILFQDNICTTIIILNSFKEIKYPLSYLFNKGVSSKGKNRGLGLYTLREVVNQHKNVILTTEIKNDTFVQKLEINNQGKMVKDV